MRIELSQQLFKRLVQLYLLAMALAVAGAIYEAASPTWTEFGQEFDVIVDLHFGARDERLMSASLWIALIMILVHLACTLGLLRYKRWARTGFWVSILFGLATEFLIFPLPSYQSPWLGWLTWMGEGLFGAILLLAYAREYGGQWFMSPMEKLKETF